MTELLTYEWWKVRGQVTWAGLQYANQRWYPETPGRFTSPDPYHGSRAITHPQGWNRYVYTENDPINFFDPWGTNLAIVVDGVEWRGSGRGERGGDVSEWRWTAGGVGGGC